MNTKRRETLHPTATDFLAYIEGSMSGPETRRFQDAVCANPLLLAELEARRREHWQRLSLPELSDLSEELEQWDSKSNTADMADSWSDRWGRIQEFCSRIGGELVAGIESAGEAIRHISDTPWVPVPTATRLGKAVVSEPPNPQADRGPRDGTRGRIHLQRGGGSLMIRPIRGGFEFTVRPSGITEGRAELKGPAGDRGEALARLPRTQVAHLEGGEATLRLEVNPGIHPVVIEIGSQDGNSIRWVCLVNRMD